jgi:GAF domain-containing protein/CheY-like chemotaxis protein
MDDSVLLIEDDALTGELLVERMRNEFAIQVKHCASGNEALELLRQNPDQYKVLLLDWVLDAPDNGPDILKKVKAIAPHLPVAAMTGRLADASRDIYQLGADLYFRKPIDFAGMASIIRELANQDAVFHRIASATGRLVKADQILVWRFDRATANLVLAGWAERLKGNSAHRKTLDFAVKNPQSDWLKEVRPQGFIDLKTLNEFPAGQMAYEQGWKSVMMRPLRQSGDLLGLVQIFSTEVEIPIVDLGSPALTALSILMESFADTIVHANQARKNRELLNFSKSLPEILDLNSIGAMILAKGLNLVEADAAVLYLRDLQHDRYVLQGQVGTAKFSLPKFFKARQATPGEDEIQALIQTVEKLGSDYGKAYVVPLCSPRMLLGALVFARRRANPFSESEFSLARGLGDIATPIIDLARVSDYAKQINEAVWKGPKILREKIVEAAYALTGRSVCLWLMSNDKKEMTVQAHRNISKSFVQDARIEISEQANSLIKEAFSTKKPVQVEDVQALNAKIRVQLIELASRENLRATLVVPVFDTEGQPVGAITLHNSSPINFSDYEVSSLNSFATQIGEGFGYFERQRRLEQLIRAGKRTIHADITGTTIMDEIAEEARKITGADFVAIYPYDPNKEDVFDVDAVGMAGIPKRLRKQVDPKTRKMGLAPIVRYLGKLVVYDDQVPDFAPVNYRLLIDELGIDQANLVRIIVEQSEKEGHFIRRMGVRSFIGITMREEPIGQGQHAKEAGLLYIDFKTPHQFTPSEINTIELLAQQIAGQIRAARLHGKQQGQIDVLQGVLNAIGSQADPLPAIMRETARLFGADSGSINRFDKLNNQLRTVALWEGGTLKQDSEIPANRKFIDVGKGIGWEVVKTGRTWRVDDVRQEEHYLEWDSSTRSELDVPIKDANGEVFGVLNLEKNMVDGFSHADETLAEQLAITTFSVFEKATLLETTQQLTHQFSLIYDVVGEKNLETTLQRIVDSLCTIMGEESTVSINLYEAVAGGRFHSIVAAGPLMNEVKMPPRPSKEESIARHVVDKKVPYYLERPNQPEYPDGPIIRKEMIEHGVRSMAAIPLLYKKEVKGILFVHLMHEHSYDQHTRNLLVMFASQAAVALETARRVFDLPILREIYESILTESLDDVLDLIVKRAAEALPGDYCELWLEDENTSDLVQRAVYAPRDVPIVGDKRLRPGEKSTNRLVLETGQPVIINDLGQNEIPYQRRYKQAKSAMVVPMIASGRIIGTINIESDMKNSYSDSYSRQLSEFANAAAIIIMMQQKNIQLDHKNAELDRLNSRLERKMGALKIIYKIGQDLTSGIQRSEHEIFSIIHEQARRILDTDNMFIALYDEKADLVWFELAFLDGKPVNIASDPGWQPRRKGNGRAEWIIRHKKPIITYTAAEAEEWYGRPESKDYIGQKFASWVGVPMLFGNSVYGVIATYHKTEEFKYDPDDIELLNEMASLAAIALENARLVQRLDTRIRELDSLRSLSEDLNLSLQN